MVQPQEKDNMIRAAGVEDRQLVSAGNRGLLEGRAEIKIIADAGGEEKAVDLVRDLKPGVVLMDIQMPRLGGFKGSPSQHL